MVSTESRQLQTLGYEKVRLLFPESDQYRLAARSTKNIKDDFQRFQALFPPERYGVNRSIKIYEDPSTWFQDLDPTIAVEMREREKEKGSEFVTPQSSVDTYLPLSSALSNPPALPRNASPSSIQSEVSRRTFNSALLAPAIPREFEGEENELLEDNGDANFSSMVDLFALRMKSIIDEESPTIGKEAYLEACQKYRTSPNIYFLDNLPRTHIDLNNYNCSPDAVMAISSAMKVNTTIQFLDLSNNHIGDKAGETLMNALLPNTTIKTLVLVDNKLGNKTGVSLSKLLVMKSTKISTLNLSKNNLDDLSATSIGDAMNGKNKTVTSLDLSENNITSNGASGIFRILDRRHLVHLDMSGNKLNVVESFGLSRRLPDSLKEHKALIRDLPDLLINSALRTLDLSFTNLGNLIAKVVAQAISDGMLPLSVLNLNHCQIEKEGGIALANGIMGTEKLTKLHFRGNSVGFDCCLMLIEAIASCLSLSFLDLRDCMLEANRDPTAAPLVKRNWGGVSKEMVEKALVKQEKYLKIQAEMAAANGAGMIGKKGKKGGKVKKENKGKKGKKGPAVDLSSIPKMFFDRVVQDAIREREEREEIAANPPPKEESPIKPAKRKSTVSKIKAVSQAPDPFELEIAANPVSWQLPMDALTKTKTILQPEDRLSMLRRRVLKINNIRSGSECEILVDGTTYD